MHNCVLEEVDEELIEEPPVSGNYKRLLFDDRSQTMVAFFRDGGKFVRMDGQDSATFNKLELAMRYISETRKEGRYVRGHGVAAFESIGFMMRDLIVIDGDIEAQAAAGRDPDRFIYVPYPSQSAQQIDGLLQEARRLYQAYLANRSPINQ